MTGPPVFTLRRAVVADAALLARVAQDARAREAASIWLTAWSGNAQALGFYAALGWRDVGLTRYLIGGASYDNRILVKTLR